jgi:hypothetical protein
MSAFAVLGGCLRTCSECLQFAHSVDRHERPKAAAYSAQATRAFKGISQTKSGTRILTESKMDALTNIAKHLGMFRTNDADKAIGSMATLMEEIQAKGSKAPIATSAKKVRPWCRSA